MLFLAQKTKFSKKKNFFGIFFSSFFFKFFPKNGKKCHFPQRKFLFQHIPNLIFNSGQLGFDFGSAGEKNFS